MKRWGWGVALAAGLMFGCSKTNAPAPTPREVQEGHGGDGVAAQFVDSARSALMQIRFTEYSPEVDGPLARLERLLEATPIHSTETLESVSGTPLKIDDVLLGKMVRSPRTGQSVMMLDRRLMRRWLSGDDRVVQQNLAGPALRAYLLLDPEDAKVEKLRQYILHEKPGSLAVPESEDWKVIGHQLLDVMAASQLSVCSGFKWLAHLIDTVKVEATDSVLRDADTGFEVDAITVNYPDGTFGIRYNRSRLASVPQGTPRSLLILHEYLRSAEDNRMERDQFYLLSSDLAQQATWPVPLARAAATGTAEYVGTAASNLCKELHNHFGLPND